MLGVVDTVNALPPPNPPPNTPPPPPPTHHPRVEYRYLMGDYPALTCLKIHGWSLLRLPGIPTFQPQQKLAPLWYLGYIP